MLIVSYPFEPRGNTIPYPPFFDAIRCNHGFVDLRGRPDLVRQIPETDRSAALASLLTALAEARSAVISLGCDLGEHSEKDTPLSRRRISGGYVQILNSDYSNQDREALLALAKHAESILSGQAGGQHWTVRFELQPVHLDLDKSADTLSIWLWFSPRALPQPRLASAASNF